MLIPVPILYMGLENEPWSIHLKKMLSVAFIHIEHVEDTVACLLVSLNFLVQKRVSRRCSSVSDKPTAIYENLFYYFLCF